MTRVTNYMYRGFSVDIAVYANGHFSAKTVGVQTSESHPHETMASAKAAMNKAIDEFVEKSPKDWSELADAITDSLEYGCGDCYVDKEILKILVERFLTATQKRTTR